MLERAIRQFADFLCGVTNEEFLALVRRMRRPMKKPAMLFLMIGLCFTACSGGTVPSEAEGNGAHRAQNSSAPESLSAAGEQELRTIVASERLADLQWPNFLEHRDAVKEFYDEAGYRLGWSRGGKPTKQAMELIGILEDADEKGLDSNDYDGARWPDRLRGLQSAGASESDLVRFDVALTVSAIRYGSDLHLGKVDPKTLHKDFDPEREKHNAGGYLWKNVVGAQSVQATVAAIESPYPGYQRTLVALKKYLQMAKEEVPDPLPQVTKPIMPGQEYGGAGKLVKRLQFLGDLPASLAVPENSQAYSGDVVEGVKRFHQARIRSSRQAWTTDNCGTEPANERACGSPTADTGTLAVGAPQFLTAPDHRKHTGVCSTYIRTSGEADGDDAGRGRPRDEDADTRPGRRYEVPDFLAVLECTAQHFAWGDHSKDR